MATTAMNKYRNKITTVDGVKFHSLKESRRYSELKLLERAGKIKELTLQPKFQIEINGVKICSYIGDFKFIEMPSGQIIVEDVKSIATKTASYRIKAKLMFAIWGITIRET